MLIKLVQIHVLSGAEEKFMAATRANAAASRREPGIVRFDMIQQSDAPTRFVLIEVYRTPEAVTAHKETEHYKTWNKTVASMMASDRTSLSYSNIDPLDGDW